jgi:hypothetical protein
MKNPRKSQKTNLTPHKPKQIQIEPKKANDKKKEKCQNKNPKSI